MTTIRPHPSSTLFPYTTLFRSSGEPDKVGAVARALDALGVVTGDADGACPPVIASVLADPAGIAVSRSEEHTSELQSRRDLVCRLLLEKINMARLSFLFSLS